MYEKSLIMSLTVSKEGHKKTFNLGDSLETKLFGVLKMSNKNLLYLVPARTLNEGFLSMTRDEKLGFNELFPMPRAQMSYLKYCNATTGAF